MKIQVDVLLGKKNLQNNSKKPTLIANGLKDGKKDKIDVNKMNAAELSKLGAQELKKLNSVQLNKLNPSQLNKLDVAQLKKLNPANVKNLNHAQKAKLAGSASPAPQDKVEISKVGQKKAQQILPVLNNALAKEEKEKIG